MESAENLENKKKWAALCQVADFFIPIFMQPEWLDSVCAHTDNWQVLLEIDSNNNICAALIINLENKKFYSRISAPHLTPHAGIWFREKLFKQRHESNYYRKKIISSLIERIPKATFTEIRLLPQNADAQPFFWNNYELNVRYTYRLNIENNRALLLKNMNDNTRRNIKKGVENYNLSVDFSIEYFTKLLDATFNRQNKTSSVSKDVWLRLEQNAHLTPQRLIFFAADKLTKAPEAAVYVVFNSETAYYVAGGCTEEGRKKGALYFLLWQAILNVPEAIKVFDFEGSMLPTVEPVFRGFNAEQTPFLVVRKTKNIFWRLLELIKKSD